MHTLEGEVVAWLYVLNGYEGGLPSARYLGIIADAAESAGAPDDYVMELRNRPCTSARKLSPGTLQLHGVFDVVAGRGDPRRLRGSRARRRQPGLHAVAGRGGPDRSADRPIPADRRSPA